MGKMLYFLLFAAIAYFFIFPYVLNKGRPGLPPPTKPPQVGWMKAATGAQNQFNDVSAQLNAASGSGRARISGAPVRSPFATPHALPNPAAARKEFQRVHEAMGLHPATPR